MPNGKRMDIDKAVRTILSESPAMRAFMLVKKVHDKTYASRSTIYVHLDTLVERETVFRDKGWYSTERLGLTKTQKRHRAEIVAGLLAVASGGRYTVSGTVAPDVGKVELARQHLKSGYPRVFNLEDKNRVEFSESARQLAHNLENGDQKLIGFCDECGRIKGKPP